MAPRRNNFILKGQEYFNYLVQEFGYELLGIEYHEYADSIIYQNTLLDRRIVLYNAYHPVDYGFELQLYRPSVSIESVDREFQIYKLKEEQDDTQEYLRACSEEFLDKYRGIIEGTEWVN